jgi:hypothetical protein
MNIQHRHNPGQMNPPRKTSSEYKRELGASKDNFKAKKTLIEKMTKVMFNMIDLSEEHAFLCEVPGYNNKTYLQLVDASRQAHPYYPPHLWHGDRVKARLEHKTNTNTPIQQVESSKRIKRDGLQPPPPPVN